MMALSAVFVLMLLVVPDGSLLLLGCVFWVPASLLVSVMLWRKSLYATLPAILIGSSAYAIAMAGDEWLANPILATGLAILVSLVLSICLRDVQPDRGMNACARCGYPRTGLPSPRCPECGLASSSDE